MSPPAATAVAERSGRTARAQVVADRAQILGSSTDDADQLHSDLAFMGRRNPVTGLARCGHCRGAMVSGGKVNGDGETVFVCARRRAYGNPACDTGMHVKVSDLERAMRDAVAQWAADIDAAARDRVQQAARDSAEAAVARLEARNGEPRGRLRRLALEPVADAEAGGILGDDAWAEAALALRADHTQVLSDLERARAAAAAGYHGAAPGPARPVGHPALQRAERYPADSGAARRRLPGGPGGRGRTGGGSRRRTGSRWCCPSGRKTLGKEKCRDAASGRLPDIRVMYTAQHRNIALLVAGCYFMEMLDGTNFIVL